MKVGDKLYCYKDFDNTYEVFDIDDKDDKIFLSPENTNIGIYWFRLNYYQNSKYYYGKYFTCLRDERVKKLKRLNDISNGASSMDTRLQ
jgi:hypothetical protein